MANNKRDYSLPISHEEILESAQFNFELKIKHALRMHSTTKNANAMRINMVLRYKGFLRANGLEFIDPTIPEQLKEWLVAMESYKQRQRG